MSRSEPPPLPKMSRVLYVRVTEKLALDLRRSARRAGKTLASYVRSVLENAKGMGDW